MTKQAIFFHGSGGSDTDYFWFADTKAYLEAHGFTVWWQQLDQLNTAQPDLQTQMAYLEKELPPTDTNTILIGHSAGCPLILSLLERLQTPVRQAVLVSGFYQSISDNGYSDALLQPAYDWAKIRGNAQEILLLNSDNDPWRCNDTQARPVAEKLQAPLTVMFGEGHMGSTTLKQPYREFPLLKRLLRTS